MSRSLHVLLVAGLFAAPLQAQEKVVATVNGEPITQNELAAFQSQRPTGPGQDDARVLDELIARELVYQDAEAKKLAEKPEVKQRLAELRQQLLLSAALEEALRARPVTEAELKKAYEEGVAQFQATEYKARHILLENEADANAVIAQLNQGADFATLAQEKSTGPSARNGGDLGWFAPQQMVPPFAEAVKRLKPGEYSKQAVKTDFGWHVILLEDARQAEPPTLDQVREKLTEALRQQHVAEYVQQLRAKAKVEIK